LHFGHDVDAALGVFDQQGVIDLGQALGLELDVEHRANDLDNAAHILGCFVTGGLPGLGGCGCCCHGLFHRSVVVRSVGEPAPALQPCNAAAPPTISAISCVIWAWRWRLNVRVRMSISSPALSVAFFIAVRLAPCSDAAVSTSAW